MRVWRVFATLHLSLSDTTVDRPIPAGMAGLRHNQRHKGSATFLCALGLQRAVVPSRLKFAPPTTYILPSYRTHEHT